MPLHELPRIFYWYADYDPLKFAGNIAKMQSSRDARARAMAEYAPQVVAHLQQGREYRRNEGAALCRICGEQLGTADLTNTFVAWPQGTEHYISAHGVWTPEHSWLAGVVVGRIDPRQPPPRVTRGIEDDSWRSRIPGLSEAEATEAGGAQPPGQPRAPKTPAEKVGLKIAKAMAKVWESGELDELIAYWFVVLTPEMRAEVITTLAPMIDPAFLPAGTAPVPNNGAPDSSTHRQMSAAEMWNVAGQRAVQEGEDKP